MNISALHKWKKALLEILREAASEALPKYPFRIIKKDIDSLTKTVIFTLKVKRNPMPLRLTAREIVADDNYLISLPKKDRKIVETQYRKELSQPTAYIEEYPIAANENNEQIFKIILVDEGRIVCGSAYYFIKKNTTILSMLREQDIIALSIAYYEDKFSNTSNLELPKNTKYLNNTYHYEDKK